MEFLESLYSIPNFGIYLFVIIGFLVVLFLVILFFGKKDEQQRKQKEVQEEQSVFHTQPTEPTAFKETTIPTPVEIPVSPVSVPPLQNAWPLQNEPQEQMVTEEIKKEEAIVENVSEKDFDFDALAEAISKELESIENKEFVPKQETFIKEQEETPVTPILEFLLLL